MIENVSSRQNINIEYKYKISVVMAVYNAEDFLTEAIESVIAQDIGFENIQLILVDDGTTDSSGSICDDYAAKHPENIVSLHKEIGGVSSARNLGLKYIEGKYVNFLDSNDKLSNNACSAICRFFEQYESEVDVAALPIYFFDAQQGSHMLNNKFKTGTGVIDLSKNYNFVQLHIASCFVTREAARKIEFDSRLQYAEDSKEVNKLLLDKFALGVVSEARYHYRHPGGDSTIQAFAQNPSWYIPCIRHFHLEILELAKQKVGYVPKFLQYALMYDLQWRFKVQKINSAAVSQKECDEYKQLIKQVLFEINDDIIKAVKNCNREHKIAAWSLKYGKEAHYIRRNQIAGTECGIDMGKYQFSLNFLTWDNDKTLRLEGFVETFCEESNVEVILYYDGEPHRHKVYTTVHRACFMNEPIVYRHRFVAVISLNEHIDHAITFGFVCGKNEFRVADWYTTKYFPFPDKYKNAYSVQKNWLIRKNGTSLDFRKKTVSQRIIYELKFLRELSKIRQKVERNALIIRPLVTACKLLKRKPIWLVRDRILNAGDSGEAFFRYMQKEHKNAIHTYFVLSKKSQDYQNLQTVGRVIDDQSFLHKFLFLLCDYNISTHADAITMNPFLHHATPYRDLLCEQKYVFLQHGVIKDDLSGWLHRFKKNIYGFVTTANPEYDSILNGNYFYTEKEIWLTGLPRFDRLYHDDKKQIVFMPTWRRYLMEKMDPKTGIWSLSPAFAESEYVRFYRALFKDVRLAAAAEKYGYKLYFYPHPTIKPYAEMFTGATNITTIPEVVPYRQIYAESSLIVSDYSSAIFDFSYLHKPVIYAHFDWKEFFSGGHVYIKGYFNYERDGFGEVEYDLESTISRIIEYMENGCQLKDKYKERIDQFFAFHDQNNCRRVYEKIMESEQNI